LKKFIIIVITLTFLLSLVLTQAIPASACKWQVYTPGYWKNHTDAWPTMIDPETYRLSDIGIDTTYGDPLLIEALKFQGGPGLDGAAEILLRAAVATYLNFCISQVPAPTLNNLLNQINAHLNSGIRSVIISYAAELDEFNNSDGW
jgi:hypothetical protein